MTKPLLLRTGFIFLVLVTPTAVHGAACRSIATLALPNTTITLAAEIPAGSFTPPEGVQAGDTRYARLASFCRVAATLKPSALSDIRIEVWLPLTSWNRKLVVLGNGSFGGVMNRQGMASWLADGYVTASTDTGHTGPAGNTFVNEEVLIDFVYRAIHETTVVAKHAINSFYEESPKFSYFNGCSTGGRQGLVAAERYPQDFDGIVAGAPSIRTSTQTFGQIWIYQALGTPEAALPREKLQLLHDSVVNRCDVLDGNRDGVLENPMMCSFDPGTLMCAEGAAGGSCLTRPQVDAVRKVYAGASNSRTGQPVYAGLERGGELGWRPDAVGYAVNYLKYLVFKDANWDPTTLNFDTHLALARQAELQLFDVSSDLTAFTSRGGKLILYHGWSDATVPPRNLVTYYDDILAHTQNATDSVRLFMVPGMGHCGGGDGASFFNMVQAIDAWVSQGQPPDRMIGSRFGDGKFDRTRPLCRWPQTAKYKGTGSIDDETSFECRD